MTAVGSQRSAPVNEHVCKQLMKRANALARPSATGIRNREEAGSSSGPRPDGANQPKRLRARGNGTSAPANAEPSGGSKRFHPARSALGLPGPWDCPTQGRIRPSRVQRGPLRGSGRSAAALCAAAALCTQHSAHTLRGVQSAALRQAPVARSLASCAAGSSVVPCSVVR